MFNAGEIVYMNGGSTRSSSSSSSGSRSRSRSVQEISKVVIVVVVFRSRSDQEEISNVVGLVVVVVFGRAGVAAVVHRQWS